MLLEREWRMKVEARELYHFVSEDGMKRVLAQLEIASWMGLIPKADFEAVEERRRQKNKEIEEKLAAGETVYGITHYTPAMYLEYELTRFRLEFTVYTGESVGKYSRHVVTEQEKQDFYDGNKDLFTRYFGDAFAYGEVSMIIEKRLREQEYENIIQDILR